MLKKRYERGIVDNATSALLFQEISTEGENHQAEHIRRREKRTVDGPYVEGQVDLCFQKLPGVPTHCEMSANRPNLSTKYFSKLYQES